MTADRTLLAELGIQLLALLIGVGLYLEHRWSIRRDRRPPDDTPPE